MDYTEAWNFENFVPTYLYDARKTPWPFKDKQYDLFIALRVFQHLFPKQKEAFLEAKRIAKNIIIVVPETYRDNRGIPTEKFIEWNNNKKPSECIILQNEFGKIYFWKEKDLLFK
jgi:hypothetical protein